MHALWKKPTDDGTYSEGSWIGTGGLSLDNLKTPDVMELARSTDTAEASTCWRIDFGRLVPLSCFAILNHNGTVQAKRRHVITNSPTNSGAPVYDTGMERMRVATEIWGGRPFGAFSFDGVDTAAYPGGTIDLHFAPSTVYGRYLFTYVSDVDNPAGYFQAGRFMAGEAWSHRVKYGFQVRTVDPSETRRTRGGRRLVRRRPRYRTMTMTFEAMTERDAFATGFEIENQLGKDGDFLLVYDQDDDPSIQFRRTIYAALVDTAGITTTSHQRYGWSMNAEELI